MRIFNLCVLLCTAVVNSLQGNQGDDRAANFTKQEMINATRSHHHCERHRSTPRVIKQKNIPFVIKKPGLYVLDEDIRYHGEGAAITILAPAVLDMKGHTIDLEGKGNRGILISQTSDVTVLNGGIRNGPFNVALALAEDLDIPNTGLCGTVCCQTGSIPNITQAALRIDSTSVVVIEDILIDKCLYGICGTNLGRDIRIDHVSIFNTGLNTQKTASVIIPPATTPTTITIDPYPIGVGILLAGQSTSNLVEDIRIYNSMATSPTSRCAFLCVFSDGADIKNCQSVSAPILSVNPSDPDNEINPILVGGFQIQDSQNAFIRDCESRGGTQHVEIQRSSGVSVTNFVGNDTNNDGIEITDCQYCSVYDSIEHRTNNQGLETQGTGFNIVRSNAITIQNATASNFVGRNTPTSTGVKTNTCANCLVKDCVAVNCDIGFSNVFSPIIAVPCMPFTPSLSSNKFYSNYAANNVIANFGSDINDVVYVIAPLTVAYPYNNIAPSSP